MKGIEGCVMIYSLITTTDETFSIKDRIAGVHGSLVFCGITDQPLGVGECDIRRGGAVTLVISNDLNTIVLPDTDTARWI